MPGENDVVLIYYQDKPSIFARIESIKPDNKKGWYHVTLLLLTIPTQIVTWILRDTYIDGSTFTMGGMPVRLEEIKRIQVKKKLEGPSQVSRNKGSVKTGTIIPLKKP